MWKKCFAALLCVSLMISAAVLAGGETDGLEERIQELEEKVEALEKAISALQEGDSLQTPADDIRSMEVGESVQMRDNLHVQVDSFYFCDSFEYYTSTYGRSRSLQASEGYDILCLLVNYENDGISDISVDTLLNVEAVWNDGDREAYDKFYCEISDGYFYSGVSTVGGNTAITGAILFAIPEDDVENNGALSVKFNYGEETYSCMLREDSSVRMPSANDAVSF